MTRNSLETSTIWVILFGVILASGALGQAPPTPVITYGYQVFGTVADWTFTLADAIARRAGERPEGGLDNYDVNREHPDYECHAQSSTPGVCAWKGTGYNLSETADPSRVGPFTAALSMGLSETTATSTDFLDR